MRKCECGGLVPPRSNTCPNCDVTVRSGKLMPKVLIIVALAASACGPTVMAVYGVPVCADGSNPPCNTTDGGTTDGGK